MALTVAAPNAQSASGRPPRGRRLRRAALAASRIRAAVGFACIRCACVEGRDDRICISRALGVHSRAESQMDPTCAIRSMPRSPLKPIRRPACRSGPRVTSTAAARPERIVLDGRFTRLEPLDIAKHGAQLFEASAVADGPARFAYLAVDCPATRAQSDAYLTASAHPPTRCFSPSSTNAPVAPRAGRR